MENYLGLPRVAHGTALGLRQRASPARGNVLRCTYTRTIHAHVSNFYQTNGHHHVGDYRREDVDADTGADRWRSHQSW